MSLINDAIKRASAARGKQEQEKKPLPNFMQPVERLGRRRRTTYYLFASIVLLIISLVLAGLWIKERYFNKKQIIVQAKDEKIQNVKTEKAQPDVKVKQKEEFPAQTTASKSNAAESGAVGSSISEIGRTETVSVVMMNIEKKGIKETAQSGVYASDSKTNTDASITTTEVKQKNEQENRIISQANLTNSGQSLLTETASIQKNSEKQVVSKNTPQTESVQSIPPKFPELKLNGIFYRSSKPSAIINGRLISLGEEIEGAKVISIERNSVTVEFSNQTRILRM